MEAYKILEEEYAEFCGNPNTVACSSGTAALHLALETLRITESWKDNDQIIIPDFTMIACARAATLTNLKPKFCDVDELGLLKYGFNGNDAVAVMPVHLYGRQCATNFNKIVIEDLAEAHGIQPDPNSSAACWSFYKNKVIHGEEGGIVAFKTSEQVTIAKELRCLGMNSQHNFWHQPRGMNYRMSNAHAWLIVRSLTRYHENISCRRRVETMYNDRCPGEWKLPPRKIPWVYDINLEGTRVNIEEVVSLLNKKGIAARCSFKPLSQQEEYLLDNEDTHNPMAEKLSKTRMYLPLGPRTRRPVINEMFTALEEAVESFSPHTGLGGS